VAAARADLYQRVAEASPAELESMIAGLSREEGSTERDFALGALLERYAEIDAPRAARVARDSGVHGPPLGLIYAQWATADAAGALEALRSVEDSADAAAIGLALIGALGGNASVIERVGMALLGPDHAAAAAIGPTGFAPFVVGVPGGAGPFGSRSALPSVAASWAMRDTEDALAIVREIRNSTVRGVFETAVLREWARTEPEAMLAHLATLDRATQQRVLFGGALGEVARAEPERLLEMARSFPPELRMPLEQMTLQAIAQRDRLGCNANSCSRRSLAATRNTTPTELWHGRSRCPHNSRAWLPRFSLGLRRPIPTVRSILLPNRRRPSSVHKRSSS
jgi:hypothetical protein